MSAALGGSFRGALSRGLSGVYYHGANTWHDLMGMGLDAGASTPFKFSAQWEGSFADSGFKNGFSLSSSMPGGINFSLGQAVYADVTFTGRMEDLLWMGVRPNANGNTGRYNKPGRSSDKNYSDDFLKWYYDIDEENED